MPLCARNLWACLAGQKVAFHDAFPGVGPENRPPRGFTFFPAGKDADFNKFSFFIHANAETARLSSRSQLISDGLPP